MTDTATLITQLRVLTHLTRTGAQIARLRVAQATGDDVREVLRRGAVDAEARATRIGDVLHDLGALPDPSTPVLGRVAALVRATVEQTQPLDEALLGDLGVAHQVRDRARYVAALADAAGLPAVRALADDLDAAQVAAIDWLAAALAGLAGGAAALDASPLQRVAAQMTRAANAPARAALDDAATPVRAPTDEPVAAAAEPAPEPESDARTEPPIPGFAALPAHAVIAALRSLDDPGSSRRC